MPNYRRAFAPGGTFFFTLVTAGRRPILTGPLARRLLRAAFRDTRRIRPFEMLAITLLLEHLHALWRLPSGDADFSTRWSQIKA